MNLPADWYIESSGERRILDQEKVAAEIERLKAIIAEKDAEIEGAYNSQTRCGADGY